MFTDPLSVTYNAVATPMTRKFSVGRTSVYESADDALKLTIAHSVGKRERSEVRLDHKKNAVDPFNSTLVRPYNMSVYLVINRPLNSGYTDAEAQYVYDALNGFAAVAANRTKILGQES